MNTGEKIKKLRKEKGLTQLQLAEKCGMYDSGIRRIENSDKTPTMTTLNKIARALEVSELRLLPDRPQLTSEEIAKKAEYQEQLKKYKKESSFLYFMDLLESIKNVNLVGWGEPWEENGYIIEYEDTSEGKVYKLKLTMDELHLFEKKTTAQIITELKYMHPSGEDSRAVFQLFNKNNRLE